MLFTSNPQFFPGSTYRHPNAITSFEFHLGYYIKPKMWMSFDSKRTTNPGDYVGFREGCAPYFSGK